MQKETYIPLALSNRHLSLSKDLKLSIRKAQRKFKPGDKVEFIKEPDLDAFISEHTSDLKSKLRQFVDNYDDYVVKFNPIRGSDSIHVSSEKAIGSWFFPEGLLKLKEPENIWSNAPKLSIRTSQQEGITVKQEEIWIPWWDYSPSWGGNLRIRIKQKDGSANEYKYEEVSPDTYQTFVTEVMRNQHTALEHLKQRSRKHYKKNEKGEWELINSKTAQREQSEAMKAYRKWVAEEGHFTASASSVLGEYIKVHNLTNRDYNVLAKELGFDEFRGVMEKEPENIWVNPPKLSIRKSQDKPKFEEYRDAIKEKFNIDIDDYKGTLKDTSVKKEDIVKYPLPEILKGIKVEQEHTKDNALALEISLDHLKERPDYYTMLNKAENTKLSSRHKIAQTEFKVGDKVMLNENFWAENPHMTDLKLNVEYTIEEASGLAPYHRLYVLKEDLEKTYLPSVALDLVEFEGPEPEDIWSNAPKLSIRKAQSKFKVGDKVEFIKGPELDVYIADLRNGDPLYAKLMLETSEKIRQFVDSDYDDYEIVDLDGQRYQGRIIPTVFVFSHGRMWIFPETVVKLKEERPKNLWQDYPKLSIRKAQYDEPIYPGARLQDPLQPKFRSGDKVKLIETLSGHQLGNVQENRVYTVDLVTKPLSGVGRYYISLAGVPESYFLKEEGTPQGNFIEDQFELATSKDFPSFDWGRASRTVKLIEPGDKVMLDEEEPGNRVFERGGKALKFGEVYTVKKVSGPYVYLNEPFDDIHEGWVYTRFKFVPPVKKEENIWVNIPKLSIRKIAQILSNLTKSILEVLIRVGSLNVNNLAGEIGLSRVRVGGRLDRELSYLVLRNWIIKEGNQVSITPEGKSRYEREISRTNLTEEDKEEMIRNLKVTEMGELRPFGRSQGAQKVVFETFLRGKSFNVTGNVYWKDNAIDSLLAQEFSSFEEVVTRSPLSWFFERPDIENYLKKLIERGNLKKPAEPENIWANAPKLSIRKTAQPMSDEAWVDHIFKEDSFRSLTENVVNKILSLAEHYEIPLKWGTSGNFYTSLVAGRSRIEIEDTGKFDPGLMIVVQYVQVPSSELPRFKEDLKKKEWFVEKANEVLHEYRYSEERKENIREEVRKSGEKHPEVEKGNIWVNIPKLSIRKAQLDLNLYQTTWTKGKFLPGDRARVKRGFGAMVWWNQSGQVIARKLVTHGFGTYYRIRFNNGKERGFPSMQLESVKPGEVEEDIWKNFPKLSIKKVEAVASTEFNSLIELDPNKSINNDLREGGNLYGELQFGQRYHVHRAVNYGGKRWVMLRERQRTRWYERSRFKDVPREDIFPRFTAGDRIMLNENIPMNQMFVGGEGTHGLGLQLRRDYKEFLRFGEIYVVKEAFDGGEKVNIYNEKDENKVITISSWHFKFAEEENIWVNPPKLSIRKSQEEKPRESAIWTEAFLHSLEQFPFEEAKQKAIERVESSRINEGSKREILYKLQDENKVYDENTLINYLYQSKLKREDLGVINLREPRRFGRKIPLLKRIVARLIQKKCRLSNKFL